MRVNGRATLSTDAALLALFPGTEAVVRVQADQIFPNCPRCIHRYVNAEPSPCVPGAGEEPPVPSWKRAPWACDVLPNKPG